MIFTNSINVLSHSPISPTRETGWLEGDETGFAPPTSGPSQRSKTFLQPVNPIDFQLGQTFPNLRHLCLFGSFLTIFPAAQTLQAIDSLKALNTITVVHDGRVDDRDLREFLLSLPPLKVNIAFTTGGDEKLAVLNVAKDLTFIRCPPEITDGGLALLSANRRLERICVRGPWDRITGCGLMALRVLPRLKSLELSFTHIDGLGVGHLQFIQQLKGLDLSNCENLKEGQFAALGSLHALEELNVSATAVADADLAAWRDLQHLVCLGLRSCEKITALALRSLEVMSHLKKVRADQNDQIPRAMWRNLQSACHRRRGFYLDVQI